MLVTLTSDELAVASMVGCRRHIAALQANSAHRTYADDRENMVWASHVEAACAELAVCKALRIYWSALSGPTAAGDVGGNIQVRSTRYQDGSLIVRMKDSEDARYVLVTCRAPNYHIRGWMSGREAKTAEFEESNDRDPKPYWRIPQPRLHAFQPKAA